MSHGDVAERLKAAVSKTAVGETLPEVRILSSPPKLEIGIRARNGVGAKRRLFCIPPQKILNLKGFSTLRVAQKVRFELPQKSSNRLF